MRALMMSLLCLFVVGCQTLGEPSPDQVSSDPNYLDKGSFGIFKRSLNHKAYGYEVVPDPTGKAPTELVEKFEVRPGDCSSQEGWSDCAKDRERSELTHKGRENIGQTYWYGWSLFIPEDFPSIYPIKVVLGQWHQEDSHPVWLIQHQQFGLYLDDQVLGKTRAYYKLADFFNEVKGNWTKFEFQIKWSKSDDGFVNAWVNGEKIVEYKGRTVWENKPYFKYGIYRTFVSRTIAEGGAPAQTAYYANVRRAMTREGLRPGGQ